MDLDSVLPVVFGRRNAIIYRRFMRLFLLLVFLWVLYYLTASEINSVIMMDVRDHMGGDKRLYPQDAFPVVNGSPVTVQKKGEVDEKNCNFESYILGQRVNQTDPCLIATFKKRFLVQPPPPQERNDVKMETPQELGANVEKIKWLEKLIIENNRAAADPRWPGYFIECGANDRKALSVTPYLETNYNWTGLLVEPNPYSFSKLAIMKRSVWLANVAACPTEYPEQLTLTFSTNPKDSVSALAGFNDVPKEDFPEKMTVQCIPLFTMLAAMEVTTVDYLSLAVEGVEVDVLKTIPFDRIKFKVVTVEYSHGPGKQEVLREFMELKGYRFVKDLRHYWTESTEDCLFVHESLYELATQVRFQIKAESQIP